MKQVIRFVLMSSLLLFFNGKNTAASQIPI